MRNAVAGAAVAVFARSAGAAEIAAGGTDPLSATSREMFLAAGIGAMIACGVMSFFLPGA